MDPEWVNSWTLLESLKNKQRLIKSNTQLGCEDVNKMHSELFLFNHIMAQEK